MKFDTNTTTALPCTTSMDASKSNPTSGYLQVNKYISCEQTPVAVTPPRSDKLGRELFYEPHLFFSPVLASERLVEAKRQNNNTNYNDNKSNKNSTTPATKRLMTASAVDALTSQLDALCLGRTGPKMIVPTITPEKATTHPAPASRKWVSFETDEGRFDQSFYSPKTHSHVSVKRSCRLAGLAIE
jgi:hypothetical protein